MSRRAKFSRSGTVGGGSGKRATSDGPRATIHGPRVMCDELRTTSHRRPTTDGLRAAGNGGLRAVAASRGRQATRAASDEPRAVGLARRVDSLGSNKPMVPTAPATTEELLTQLMRQHIGRPLGSQAAGDEQRQRTTNNGLRAAGDEHESSQRPAFSGQRSGEG